MPLVPEAKGSPLRTQFANRSAVLADLFTQSFSSEVVPGNPAWRLRLSASGAQSTSGGAHARLPLMLSARTCTSDDTVSPPACSS